MAPSERLLGAFDALEMAVPWGSGDVLALGEGQDRHVDQAILSDGHGSAG